MPVVLSFAPRMGPRLLDEIERLSKRRLAIAEINRRVGAYAWRMRLAKPSYEQVRVLVHTARRLRRAAPASISTVAFQVVFRERPPVALAERLVEPPRERLGDRAPPALK